MGGIDIYYWHGRQQTDMWAFTVCLSVTDCASECVCVCVYMEVCVCVNLDFGTLNLPVCEMSCEVFDRLLSGTLYFLTA